MQINNSRIKEIILSVAGNAEFIENKQYFTVTVPENQLHLLAKNLKESAECSFDYLFCMSGMDWGDSLGVIYHLESTRYRHSIVVKTKTTDRENPELDSVSDIWKTAEFHEREVFDFFGIRFRNHPDMRRIFLDDNWNGYPLRKDYKDEINIVER